MPTNPMSFTGSTPAVLCALIFFPLNVPSPCACRPVTVVQFGHMQYVSFYAWCCRRAEQTRHCITKIILILVIWQMQQRVIYSSDLLASLLSAYLPAKPMDVMIQVLSCILLFFSMPIAPVFIRLAYVVIMGWCVASQGPMLRCVVMCSRVLHPKMQQSLEYFGCPLVVVLL